MEGLFSLKDLFENEGEGFNSSRGMTIKSPVDNVHIDFRIIWPFFSNNEVYFFYLPKCKQPLTLCCHIVREFDGLLAEILNPTHTVEEMIEGALEVNKTPELAYRTVYIYSEDILSNKDTSNLKQLCHEHKIRLILKDEEYRKNRERRMDIFAFISHDSRDKDRIAEPLALGLNKKLHPTWFDKYSLKVGDNLRESIEEGIRNARKCIIIVTPNFLSNPGWTKVEFNAIFTKTLMEGNKNLVLPIWSGVTPQEVYEYSPTLANTVAINWPDENGKSEDEYKNAIEEVVTSIIRALD